MQQPDEVPLGAPDPAIEAAGPQPKTTRSRLVLGALILIGGLVMVYVLWSIWPVKISEEPSIGAHIASCAYASPPAPNAPATGPLAFDPCVSVFGWTFAISLELRLLWIVGLAAALGSFVQVATSFSTYVGNRTFDSSWTWWYVLRAPIGMALAYLFYFALRGGLLSTGTTASDLSAFGIAAISGLVGLFSKQAADKLEETFKTLFSTAPGSGDDQRGDKLNMTPQIAQLEPSSVSSSTAQPPPIVITGSGFTENTTVQVDGETRDAVYRSTTVLAFSLSKDELVAGRTYAITVTNPGPGGGTSAPIPLQIT
ncbi:MAG: hypothetical protein JO113_04935 [Candidatus Eremiobacteraeota bacterium]|nr:hypothetical protein [Candidatus Eremiobacteraeota bacterium]